MAGLNGPVGQDFRQTSSGTAASLTPRLTDFGLAKLIEDTGDDTRSEGRIGTPHYMAPEQAAGRRSEIGRATDIYALGATLYEILIGRPPFRGENDQDTTRLILESEPVPPRSLRPGLSRDLQTICLKCLRKEPGLRYTSAAALRDDLERLLAGRPIVGRPVSTWERTRSWARHRPAVAGLLALVFALATGMLAGVLAWASWLRSSNQRLEIQIARADRNAIEAKRHSLIAAERQRLADRHHYAESLRLARRALDARQVELAQDILHDIQPDARGFDPRDFAWRHLWRRAHREFSQLWGHEADVRNVAFSRDGKRLATRDSQGRVLIWDLAPTMPLDRPRIIPALPHRDDNQVWFTPDGRAVITLSLEQTHTVFNRFDLDSGKLNGQLDCGQTSWFGGMCFDAEGRRLAALITRPDHTQWVFSGDLDGVDHDRFSWLISDGKTFCKMFTRGRFVTATRDGHTRLLNPWSGECQVELAGPAMVNIALSVCSFDGKVFAAASDKKQISIWDTRTGRELAAVNELEALVRIAISPRGRRLAMLNERGRVLVYDLSTKGKKKLSRAYRAAGSQESFSFFFRR